MKKLACLLMVLLLVTGCGAKETLETVSDEIPEISPAMAREILLTLPLEAAVPASETENGEIYLCDGFEIALQTLPAGDLNATVQSISGFAREDLTIIESNRADYTRYDMVWSCAGENSHRIGKAAVLDDGNYHYVLSVLADEDRVAEYAGIWQEMLDSYSLSGY